MKRLAIVAILLLGARVSVAHPLAPSTLQLAESAPGVASARFRCPAPADLMPRWPTGCAVTSGPRTVADDFAEQHFMLDCAGRSLAGSELGIGGLTGTSSIAIVRVQLAGGHIVRELLGPAHPSFVIPHTSAGTPWSRTALGYVRLGFEHLLGGLDHLLFVLGLLLVVPGLRARIATLTAFTLGHSLTLGLAAAGLVRVPGAPVELLIAVTLLVVALEALAARRTDAPPRGWGLGGRRAFVLAAIFGSIHGLGFAGALTTTGLPAGDIPLALAGFNLGIELGQLAAVAAFITLAALARPLLTRLPRAATHVRPTLAYAIGTLAAMWCLERTFTALS